jgi:hypothetical protein
VPVEQLLLLPVLLGGSEMQSRIESREEERRRRRRETSTEAHSKL